MKMCMKSKFECSYINLLQYGQAHSLSALAAFPLQWLHWVLNRDQTVKLKIFTSWPFTERVADPCSQPSMENLMERMSEGSSLVPPRREGRSVFYGLPWGESVCLGFSGERSSLLWQRSAEVVTSRCLRSYSSLTLELETLLRKYADLMQH